MKKSIKVFVVLAFFAFLVGSMAAGVHADGQYKSCKAVEKIIQMKYHKFGKLKTLPTHKLTDDVLLNRKGTGKIIVERCKGTVLNWDFDGKIDKTVKGREFYNYISYRRVKNIRPGSKIVTYYVYNWNNNYCDDILERYDVVVKY